MRRSGSRSDRDIQSDYSGGGYDQVAGSRDYRGGGSEWRGGYGREGSYPQSRMPSDDDSRRRDFGGSDLGASYGGAGYGGYGYGAAGAGGVGYGAPGYGAGESYGSASRYRGDFQRDRDWLREENEGFSGYDYERSLEARYGGADTQAREGRYGQERGMQQDWRARSSTASYGDRSYPSGESGYRTQGLGYGAQSGWQGTTSGQPGRSYRGLGPRNYTRSDERIREDLNERLTDAHDIDASGLSVEVNNGVATLNGTVSERWMKHRAEDIADGCSGVRDVRNMIQVTPESLRPQGAGATAGASGSGTLHGGSQTSTSGTAAQGNPSSGRATGSGTTAGSSPASTSGGRPAGGSTGPNV
ncbi:MAG TPA: BON domain-containing protein [Xanthomonadaceae bacterium]|nr:BON domain-containing protein [Xanthomonadaceae bacterium]